VTVKEQLTRTGATPTWGPTKTGTERVIDIAAGTVALLREHRRSQAELKMRNRATYADHGLVFAKEWTDMRRRGEMIGCPLQLNNIGEREYARLIHEAEVPRKFHGLRHTCATLLLNSGEPVHNVSKRLGHSKVTMTMEVYTHLLEGSANRWPRRWEAFCMAKREAIPTLKWEIIGSETPIWLVPVGRYCASSRS
jgi:integrase